MVVQPARRPELHRLAARHLILLDPVVVWQPDRLGRFAAALSIGALDREAGMGGEVLSQALVADRPGRVGLFELGQQLWHPEGLSDLCLASFDDGPVQLVVLGRSQSLRSVFVDDRSLGRLLHRIRLGALDRLDFGLDRLDDWLDHGGESSPVGGRRAAPETVLVFARLSLDVVVPDAGDLSRSESFGASFGAGQDDRRARTTSRPIPQKSGFPPQLQANDGSGQSDELEMGKKSKATKKFSKNHLAQTISDRRKHQAKRQQVDAQKQKRAQRKGPQTNGNGKRKAEELEAEDGTEDGEDEELDTAGDMTVDDLLNAKGMGSVEESDEDDVGIEDDLQSIGSEDGALVPLKISDCFADCSSSRVGARHGSRQAQGDGPGVLQVPPGERPRPARL